jgi:hypothetical protein
MNADELRRALSHFTGTDEWHKHMSGLLFTDGVKFLADTVGAYWLIDLIASWQKRARKDRMLREIQIWELRVDLAAHTAIAVCLRDTNDEAFRQEIPFTDFPLESVKFYLENDVLCLPSER